MPGLCSQPRRSCHFSGTRCLSSRVMLAMHCPPPRGRAGRPARAWTKLPDWITYAWPLVSVLLLSIRDARARDAVPGGAAASPLLPLGPIRFHPTTAVALGEADGTELPPRGKGCFRPGVLPAAGTPTPGRVTPGCFINIYIYIFCSKVLLPHVRAGAPRTARIPKPGLSEGQPRQCPGGSHPTLGVPLPH